MAFEYATVVPWGRSFDEYRRMFNLTENDLQSRILGCGDGPASFNATMNASGRRVVSVDPLYRLSAGEIHERIEATCENVIAQTLQNESRFVWTDIKSVDELEERRRGAMETFLADYDSGRQEGRYLVAELPGLPFEAGAFDLALCSHLLFMYSHHLPLSFHEQAVPAMCRAAREARIFPLLTYNSEPCAFVEPLMEGLLAEGYIGRVEDVPYEFQRGANKMLRVSHGSVPKFEPVV